MRLHTLFAAIALALSVGASAQGTVSPPATQNKPLTQEVKDTVLKEVNRIVTTVAFVPGIDFTKWPQFIEGEKDTITKADTPQDFTLAINMALRKFGVSHIVLTTPQMATARRTSSTVGIGISIQPEPGKGIRVTGVFDNSPAATAGLQAGDLIVEANGKKIDNPAEMQGEEGSTVKIKVDRSGKPKEFKIVRRKYSNVRPEKLTWVDPETAVLKIYTFDLAYDGKNVEKLMTEAAKAKSLIIDLRSNGGGAVTNLMHFLSMVLPDRAPVGTFVQRTMVNKYVQETGGSATDLAAIAKWADRPIRTGHAAVEPFKGNVAVMVNGGSGSASEIAAAALHEDLDAPVIGTKSAGAVLVSIMGPLPEGYMMQYPVTDFVTPNGVRLEGNGVEPTLEASGIARFGEKDEAQEKAVMLMHRLAKRADGSGIGK